MTTSYVPRARAIAAAAALFVFHSMNAQAVPAKGLDLLTGRGAAETSQLPAFAKAESGISGTLNPGALSAPVLDLSLADGTVIEARLQRVAQDNQKGTQSWVGTFDDSPGSSLVLSRARGVVSGFVSYKDQTLEIMPSRGGKHVMYAVDSSKLPQHDGVHKFSTTSPDALSTTATAADTLSTTSTNGVVQDLLVLYTPASASKYGSATIQSMIQSAVQNAIQAYQNSFVNVTLNIVGLQQAPMSEASGMQNTLTALANNTTIRALRNNLGADMVVLVSENSDYCGWAGIGQGPDGGTDAYAVVWSNCLSGHSLAHEVGHLQGLDHNREDASSGGGFYPYGYGYRVCVSNGFRDVMSYQCPTTGVPRILQFSNPSVYYNGYATGIDYDLHPSTAADTHRALNNSAATVAAYRTSTSTTTPTAPTVPNAPGGLATTSVAYNSVSLSWADNSSDEAGFKVERSPDGVTFAEIASLGTGTVSYRDGSVSARTNYYYRVRAYNSVGNSAYSNTVSLTTPDVPPPPPAPPAAPTSVAAANDGDGTATVVWAASSAATAYDVLREKWDTRKSVWTGATTVASVTSSFTSLVDASGSGTYRYSVRAKNPGGASAYAGPASVTVTSPTSGKRGGPKSR